MLLPVMLLIIFMVLVFFIIDQSYQAKKLKKRCAALQRELKDQVRQQEKYSLGLVKTPGEMLDPLTGLTNRTAFEDRLSQILNQSKRYQRSFAVLVLNINDFSSINETYTHDVGDQLLIELSKRLQKSIRQVDTVTRFAGDNFIFLLPQLSTPETAAYVAQRLVDSVEKPIIVNNQMIQLAINVGISIYPSDGENIKTLLIKAENAMQAARKEGRNKFQFFQPEMHALGQRELSLSAFIREPDLLNRLIIYYQPQVDTQTQRIIRLQAVPYLQHATYGLISFQEFAKFAENNGRIIEVGEWLLNNAIDQLNRWQDTGISSLQLAMYVTLRQIESGEFIEKVKEILLHKQVPASRILFEIYEDISSTTRDAYSADAERLKVAFAKLKELGVETAVSIVGLGHFALNKITKLPINHIKIDNKLILDMADHPENENILNMILALSKNLNIGIIAEGIEHETQKAIMQKMGCEVMQGDLFASPQTAEGLAKSHLVS